MTRLGEKKWNESRRGEKGFNISKEIFLSPFLKLLFAVRLSGIKAMYQHAQVTSILTFPMFAELLILEH